MQNHKILVGIRRLKMEARECTILSGCLAQPGAQYVVPVYQRNYTWDNKNVMQLLQDIYSLLEKTVKEKDKNVYHFIGSIVNLRRGEGMFFEREIIDGQQRLTTIFLILYVLRDIAIKQGNIEIENSLRNYLENLTATGQNERYRNKLKPNLTDDGVLQKIIDQRTVLLKSSKSSVWMNYKTIKLELSQWISEGYSLTEIIEAIDHIIIVFVSISDVKSAQQTFESINSTGEPLKASDLVRNYVLMNFNDDDQTRYYKKYWLELEQNIIPDQESFTRKQISKKTEEFLRFYLSLKKHKMIALASVYEEFKTYWESIDDKENEEKIEELCLFSSYYYNLHWKDINNFPDYMRKSLLLFRQIASTMCVPFLLGLWDLFYNQKIDEFALDKGIRLIDIYILRRAMADKDTSPITSMFPALFNRCVEKCEKIGYENFIEVLKYFLCDVNVNNAMSMPNEETIRMAMLTNNAYSLAVTKIFFSVIETEQNWNGIENAKEDNEPNPIALDIKPLTIEHIMPQESTFYWSSRIGDVPQTMYSQIVNLIGNLTLADRKTNSKMNNRDFEYKKEAIAEVGRLNINRDIINSPEWTIDQIKERTLWMIQMFNIKFPYFSSSLKFEESQEFEIFISDEDTIASATLFSSGKVVVHKGARIKNNVRATLKAKALRDDYVNRGWLEYDNETKTYVTQKDVDFMSLSTATSFVYGGCNDGWLIWKDEQGAKINDTLRHRIEQSTK